MNNLFAYGSLMYEQVWQALFGEVFVGEVATLEGYSRRRIKGDVYPVIFPGDGSVQGILFRNLTEAIVEKLDRFEGDLYQRVQVEVMSSSVLVPAFTYVLKKSHYGVIGDHWNKRAFESSDLSRFLSRYTGFDQ